MRATQLRASNFKGRTFEHALGPITVFAGPNSAGKSARLEALQLALAGFVPGVPASPAGIYGAFGGKGDMTVGAILECVETGESYASPSQGVIRSFRPKGKSVSREDRWDKLPTDWAVPPVAVDATEYLQTSERERTRMLFKLAKLTRLITAETITAEIKNISIDKNTEATQTFISQLCLAVENSYKSGRAPGDTIQEWLIDRVEYLRDKLKSAKANVDRMNLTVQGITQLRAAQPPADGTIQDVERRLAQARTEETSLATELGRLEGQLNANKQQQTNLERLETQLAGPLADCTEKLAQAKAKLDEAVKRHGAKPDTDALRKRQKEVVDSGKRIRAEIDALEHQITQKERAHDLKMKHEECPYCGTNAPGWKKKSQAEHEVEIHNLTVQRDAKNAQREPVKAEFNELEQRLSAANQTQIVWDRQERALNDLRDEIHGYNTQLARRKDALEQKELIKIIAPTATQQAHRETLAALQVTQQARAALDADRLKLSAERTEALQKIGAGENAQNALNEVTILKQALEKVEILCEELVNESIKPLVARVNDICGVIMPAPLEYVSGEIGWREHGVWISKPKQLGGARRTLLFAALSVALSEPGGIVILDEFANLDRDNGRAVLTHFDDLIHRGIIGQVVMADPSGRHSAAVGHKAVTMIDV